MKKLLYYIILSSRKGPAFWWRVLALIIVGVGYSIFGTTFTAHNGLEVPVYIANPNIGFYYFVPPGGVLTLKDWCCDFAAYLTNNDANGSLIYGDNFTTYFEDPENVLGTLEIHSEPGAVEPDMIPYAVFTAEHEPWYWMVQGMLWFTGIALPFKMGLWLITKMVRPSVEAQD